MRKKKRLELEKLMKQRQKERLIKAGIRITSAIAATAVASFGVHKALENAKKKENENKFAKEFLEKLKNVENPEDYGVGEDVWNMTDEELEQQRNSKVL